MFVSPHPASDFGEYLKQLGSKAVVKLRILHAELRCRSYNALKRREEHVMSEEYGLSRKIVYLVNGPFGFFFVYVGALEKDIYRGCHTVFICCCVKANKLDCLALILEAKETFFLIKFFP